jgi:hypothetical protein
MGKKQLSIKCFHAGMSKLQDAWNYTMTEKQTGVYFGKLGKDFDDITFPIAVEDVLEGEYRFPPIAAFYKFRKPEKPDFMKGVR